MKKLTIGLVSLLAVLALIHVAGCTGGASEPAYPGSSRPSIFSMFSQPTIQVVNNGVDIFATSTLYNQAFTGEAVATAEITVSNETTGISTSCAYVGGSLYTSVGQLSHGTGESVSTTVKLGDVTMKGGPTATPNSSVTISSPAAGATVTVPFTVSWTASAGSVPAGHVWFYVGRFAGTPEGYQTTVPFSQTSVQVTSSMISGKGSYMLYVYPINKMTFTGAASNS